MSAVEEHRRTGAAAGHTNDTRQAHERGQDAPVGRPGIRRPRAVADRRPRRCYCGLNHVAAPAPAVTREAVQRRRWGSRGQQLRGSVAAIVRLTGAHIIGSWVVFWSPRSWPPREWLETSQQGSTGGGGRGGRLDTTRVMGQTRGLTVGAPVTRLPARRAGLPPQEEANRLRPRAAPTEDQRQRLRRAELHRTRDRPRAANRGLWARSAFSRGRMGPPRARLLQALRGRSRAKSRQRAR